MPNKRDLKGTLMTDGKGLPPARRRDELRKSVLESAGVDVPGLELQPAVAPVAAKKPFYRSRLAIVGYAAAVVIAALVITGVLSMGAMPGDALYPVKRFLQRTRVVLAFGSGAKAKANSANAAARVKELRYAKSKDMEDWYAPLARSATSDLTRSIQGASSAEAARKAREQLQELKDLSKDISPDDDGDLQKALDGLQQQIDQHYEQKL
jgi:hypothetical protein